MKKNVFTFYLLIEVQSVSSGKIPNSHANNHAAWKNPNEGRNLPAFIPNG